MNKLHCLALTFTITVSGCSAAPVSDTASHAEALRTYEWVDIQAAMARPYASLPADIKKDIQIGATGAPIVGTLPHSALPVQHESGVVEVPPYDSTLLSARLTKRSPSGQPDQLAMFAALVDIRALKASLAGQERLAVDLVRSTGGNVGLIPAAVRSAANSAVATLQATGTCKANTQYIVSSSHGHRGVLKTGLNKKTSFSFRDTLDHPTISVKEELAVWGDTANCPEYLVADAVATPSIHTVADVLSPYDSGFLAQADLTSYYSFSSSEACDNSKQAQSTWTIVASTDGGGTLVPQSTFAPMAESPADGLMKPKQLPAILIRAGQALLNVGPKLAVPALPMVWNWVVGGAPEVAGKGSASVKASGVVSASGDRVAKSIGSYQPHIPGGLVTAVPGSASRTYQLRSVHSILGRVPWNAVSNNYAESSSATDWGMPDVNAITLRPYLCKPKPVTGE